MSTAARPAAAAQAPRRRYAPGRKPDMHDKAEELVAELLRLHRGHRKEEQLGNALLEYLRLLNAGRE